MKLFIFTNSIVPLRSLFVKQLIVLHCPPQISSHHITSYHRSPRCSMGWLPTMTTLTKQLAADPRSTQDVRIGTVYMEAICAVSVMIFTFH